MTPLKVFLALFLGTMIIACKPDDSFDDIDRPFDNPDIDMPDTTSNDPGSVSEVELGRLLFWDPILSGELDVACASCHHPDFGYADGISLSIGVGGQGIGPNRIDAIDDDIGLVRRNAQTIVNSAFNGMDVEGEYDTSLAPMFWDNRMQSLEAQAIGPLLSFEEMRGHAYSEEDALDSIVQRLENNPVYLAYFSEIYGADQAVTPDNIGKAIAAFERSLIAMNSPFDRYQAGDDDAMTTAQIDGMHRFNEIGCDDCHSGPMFSDFELHVVGVPDHPALEESDDGSEGTYAFRTPSLRNLGETAPYFHNGAGRSLQQTIQFYITARHFATGGGGQNPPGENALLVNWNVDASEIDEEVKNLLGFTNTQIQEIVAFLEALNDPDFDRTIPTEVPSGLSPGGNIQ